MMSIARTLVFILDTDGAIEFNTSTKRFTKYTVPTRVRAESMEGSMLKGQSLGSKSGGNNSMLSSALSSATRSEAKLTTPVDPESNPPRPVVLQPITKIRGRRVAAGNMRPAQSKISIASSQTETNISDLDASDDVYRTR
eukprot:TRINITY_DN3642_c0_g1_i2.p2 TRINITY_DN3642_c0_g1~~TRINITY_DN3642_c0_g1_i2.p2  ORF type:complete len:140 (+),score=27.68 TRINITY_DN3642_c0_g1_i2:290-709(+)